MLRLSLKKYFTTLLDGKFSWQNKNKIVEYLVNYNFLNNKIYKSKNALNNLGQNESYPKKKKINK